MNKYDEQWMNGKQMTQDEIEVMKLEEAIRLTLITINNGRHCDTKLYEKAIEGYKLRIKKLEE